MNLDSIDYQILRLGKRGTTIHQISSLIFKNNKKSTYYKVYRRIKLLESHNLIKPLDIHSKPRIYVTTQEALDLLTAGAKLKPCAKTSNSIPIRARPERLSAIKLLKSCKMLNQDTRELINEKFDEYLDFCEQLKIVLRKNPTLEYALPNLPDFKVLNYSTRFTDPTKIKYQIWQYHKIFESIPPQYNKAVHLVLTTDPKRFRNLWEANRHFSVALNRFLSYLKKRLGERPLYVCAYEFTKTGLLHAHIIIFGRGFLLPKHIITAEWERCGQGSYNYIYSLTRNGNSWNYTRKRPKDLKKGDSADDYIKKYLVKALYDEEAASMYWAFNKRFYTFSYRLKDWKQQHLPPSGIWQFFGSFPEWDLPHAITESCYHYDEPPPSY